MDKRWIAILIILVVGVTCMYFIVNDSTTIGSAITNLNKSQVTIPDGFSTGESDKNFVELFNKSNTDERIYLEDTGKNNDSLIKFHEKIDSLPHDIKIIKNVTNKTNDVTYYSLYYENTTNNTYESITFFTSYQHTFFMKMYGFKDTNSMDDNLQFIIKTLQPDYKKSQD